MYFIVNSISKVSRKKSQKEYGKKITWTYQQREENRNTETNPLKE